jgi:CDP-diacylglycerol--glycerol-3-phosphate 3-phosphatidyltransferase
MTVANQITLARIAAIPAFVMLAIYYGESVLEGDRQPWLRWTAIGVFVVAAVSDGLDGFVARRFNQHTKLGTILDPIADKGLLLSALLVLTFGHWEVKFPLWFLILVIARDIAILMGCALLQFLNGDVIVRPSWMGKVTTVTQMAAIAWVMLQLHTPPPIFVILLAGVFTLASWVGYGIDGIRQIQSTEKG